MFRNKEDIAIAGLDGDLSGKRIILQGFGNVGYHAAKFLQEEDDAKIISIIEYNGGLTNEKGIDVQAAKDWFVEKGSFEHYEGGIFVKDTSEMIEGECDILIPAALEGVINISNADRIDANVIIEAANGPVTSGADEILRKKGVVIIPDMYANAGGVTVSYFEWVKNLSHIRFGRMQRREEEARSRMLIAEIEKNTDAKFSKEFKINYIKGADELTLVRSGLDDTMRAAYGDMRELWHQNRSDDKEFDLRTAAFMISIQRVADTYKALSI